MNIGNEYLLVIWLQKMKIYADFMDGGAVDNWFCNHDFNLNDFLFINI